jgi:hypothetical protein
MSPIPEPTPAAAMTDDICRPTVITSPRKRRSHHHLENTINQLSVHHLEVIEFERHLNTIAHWALLAFGGFVTIRK